LHDIRRVETTADFWRVCEESLDHGEPMTLEPDIHQKLEAAETGS
jgi:hypothetical protein